MRKNKLILAVLAILTVALVTMQSCKKEEIELTNDKEKNYANKKSRSTEQFEDINGISVKLDNSYDFGEKSISEWLYFETRNDYMNAIDQLSLGADSAMNSFESALSFSSMRVSKTEEERESINIEDDLLATLLNNDGRIRIGEHIFQIDASNDTLLVYSANGVERVKGFSTDDDVFDILDGIDIEDRHRGCAAKNKIKNVYFNGSYIDFKVVYQKAGIYFSLLSKISKNTFNGPNTLELNCRGFSISDNYYVKNKETKANQINSCYKSGNGKYYQYRPYQGIRKLNRFHFSTYFNVRDDVYHNELGTFSLRIDCGA